MADSRPTAGGPAWRLRPWVRLRWRELDGEHVLHEVSSGDVHLLDAASALLVRLLGEGARAEAALVDALAGAAGLGSGAAAREAVRERLEALADAGLVERCP